MIGRGDDRSPDFGEVISSIFSALLALPMACRRRALIFLLFSSLVAKAWREQIQGQLAILLLRSLRLAGNNEASGFVRSAPR